MKRLDKYGRQYESGQQYEGQIEVIGLEQTNEKKNKYYSYNDHDETIRKKLILDQGQDYGRENKKLMFVDEKEPAISTKYTVSQPENSNKTLIDRLESSLKSYQPRFGKKLESRKIDFAELDLKMDNRKQEDTQQFIPKPQVEVQTISSQLKNKRIVQESEKLIQDLLPWHRVNKVDRQIAALYKQNRNVNLEYRRDKFMQIFTGKSQLAKRDAEMMYKYS